MVEISENWVRVLGALVAGAFAWSTPGALAESLGGGEEETTDILAELDAAGWLEVWEREDDPAPAVTLSPLGAGRLGVRLVESGLDEVTHWAPAGDPEPPAPRARNVCAQVRAAELAFVPDPHPTPDEAAARADVPVRPPAGDGPDAWPWPYPNLLIGQGLSPWPGPARDHAPPCPACRNRPLCPNAYCLRCDRWGRDELVAASRPAAATRPCRRYRGPRHRPNPGTTSLPAKASPTAPAETAPGSAEQAEREQRKARRRLKMQARVAAEREGRRRPGGFTPHAGDGPALA